MEKTRWRYEHMANGTIELHVPDDDDYYDAIADAGSRFPGCAIEDRWFTADAEILSLRCNGEGGVSSDGQAGGA